MRKRNIENCSNLSDCGVHAGHLSDEDGSNGLVERCAVHIDSGSDWQHKSGDPGVDFIPL